MLNISFILFFLQSFYFIEQIYGHGYLADPPARSSAWLFDDDFSKCCKYYNHIEMSCGGTFRQWSVNGGKCSICGESNDLKTKLLGVGDAMYLGKIVRTYTQGSIIPVTVILTANHLGIFEFRVCSIDDDPSKDATQSCLNLNVLETTDKLTQYPIEKSFRTVNVNVTLPPDLVCKHCVFQWKYRTGNSWGVSNGKACLGCGRENEEFYGCSDIAIVAPQLLSKKISNRLMTIAKKEVTIQSSTTTPSLPRKCTSAIVFSQKFDLNSIMEQYCQTMCPNNCALDKLDGNEILYSGCLYSCKKLCECQ